MAIPLLLIHPYSLGYRLFQSTTFYYGFLDNAFYRIIDYLIHIRLLKITIQRFADYIFYFAVMLYGTIIGIVM